MRPSWLDAGLAALSVFKSAAAIPLSTKRTDICNNKTELCDRSYGNITFVGAHDSFAFSKDPFALSRDQEVNIPSQLGLGVRMLQAQAHEVVVPSFPDRNKLTLSQSAATTENFISVTLVSEWPASSGLTVTLLDLACLLFDGGKVVDYLKLVKTFLDHNPTDVITLLFPNPENISLKDKWLPAFMDSGIVDLAFVPPTLPMKRSEWPTLGEMIDSGKRVVVFMDAHADPSQVDFILPEFDMIWETPFSVTNDTFPCKVDRIAGPLSPEDHMHLINHSLNENILGTGIVVSDRLHAKKTNSLNSINANVAGCEQFAAGKAPNFLLLDWVNIGEGIKAADKLNGF